MERRIARKLAQGIFALGRGLKNAVPLRVRKAVDDRLFYAIFQMTRVTNDDYVSEEVRRRRQKDQDRSTEI